MEVKLYRNSFIASISAMENTLWFMRYRERPYLYTMKLSSIHSVPLEYFIEEGVSTT
jgi:hypothetical protein